MRILLAILCLLATPVVKAGIPPAPEDASNVIQTLLDHDKDAQIPAGTFIVSKTILIPDGGRLQGSGKGRTILKLKAGVNDDLIRTADFERLAGTQGINSAPANFSITGLTLDGNYLENRWNANQNKVNNTKGSCLKLYGKRFEIDVEATNCAEHGLYSEGQGPRNGEEVASTIRIVGTTFGKEAMVFRGPGDIMVEYAVLGLAGILPKPSQFILQPTSSLYPDYRMVDGVVIDRTPPYEGTVEIGFLHIYAVWNGVGFRTRGNPRLQAQHLVSESNLGGVAISRGTWGGVGLLDVHSSGKTLPGKKEGTLAPMDGVLLESVAPFHIASGHVYRTTGSGEDWTALRITGSGQVINIAIDSATDTETQETFKGDGIVVEGSGNLLNAAISRINGKAIVVNGSNNQIRAAIAAASAECQLSGGHGNNAEVSGGSKSCREANTQ